MTDTVGGYEAILQKLDDMVKSRFIEMFGNVEIRVPFKKCIKSITKGPFGSDIKKSFFVMKSENTYKVYIQINAIKSDQNLGDYYISSDYYNQKMKRFEVHSGDYIITCDGTMGRWIRLHNMEPGIISSSLLRVTIDESVVNPSYFEAMWDYELLPELLSKVRNGCLQHLPAASVIERCCVKTPSLTLQNKFAQFVKQVDKSKYAINGNDKNKVD